jgi:hypothetical protein
MKRSLAYSWGWIFIPIYLFLMLGFWIFGYLGRENGGILNGPESTLQIASGLLICSCLLGAIYTFSLGRQEWLSRSISLRKVILVDYAFDNYTTIVILSYVYSIAQGACIGGFLSGFFYWMMIDGSMARFSPQGILLPIGFILFLVITRLFIEAIILIYRVAQDISNYTKKSGSRR